MRGRCFRCQVASGTGRAPPPRVEWGLILPSSTPLQDTSPGLGLRQCLESRGFDRESLWSFMPPREEVSHARAWCAGLDSRFWGRFVVYCSILGYLDFGLFFRCVPSMRLDLHWVRLRSSKCGVSPATWTRMLAAKRDAPRLSKWPFDAGEENRERYAAARKSAPPPGEASETAASKLPSTSERYAHCHGSLVSALVHHASRLRYRCLHE